MSRLPDLRRDQLTADGQGVWDAIVGTRGSRLVTENGALAGPFNASKQRKDEVLIDVADVALGNVTKMRWNDASQWIWSDEVTHPPIITPRAQAVSSPWWRLILSGYQFLTAVDVIGRAGQCSVHHDVHGERRDAGGADHASDGQRLA
jgi:hypothetical protein